MYATHRSQDCKRAAHTTTPRCTNACLLEPHHIELTSNAAPACRAQVMATLLWPLCNRSCDSYSRVTAAVAGLTTRGSSRRGKRQQQELPLRGHCVASLSCPLSACAMSSVDPFRRVACPFMLNGAPIEP